MNTHTSVIRTRVLAAIWLAATTSFAEAATVPAGVSPGAADRVARVRTGCPTFSWEAVTGSALYELVVYRLPEQGASSEGLTPDLRDADEVLYARVPGGATSWTPELERCLAAGESYVWFARAIFEESGGVVLDATEWSEGRFFAVAAAPSVDEVARALEVLRLYLGDGGDGAAIGGAGVVGVDGGDHEEWRQGSAVFGSPERSVLTAAAAIRGEMPDPSGELYGVVGVSSSPEGAGMAAVNTASGADLVLDGSAAGVADTVLTESGLDRRSSTVQSFDFTNSGSGVMRLKENGVRVVTVNTDQDTLGDLQCSGGEVAKWSGAGWQCAEDDDEDTDTLGDLTCSGGEVAKWTGSMWQCADDEAGVLVLPYAGTHATSGATFRVNNSSTSGNVFALRGNNASNAGAAIYGYSSRSSGTTSGVVGQSSSTSGTGVFGLADADSGGTYGVAGIATSADGVGVAGFSTTVGETVGIGVHGTTASMYGYGVMGTNDVAAAQTAGVYGVTRSEIGNGVLGRAESATGAPMGVLGISESPTGIGTYGWGSSSTGVNFGVYGFTSSGDGYAGYFFGNVGVHGTLSKSGGSFKIDHPLDPANRYLQHSFVESPDMMNIYNGNVVLDASGEAWVEMPEWFEVLNRDVRYQLTAIGAPGPGLFVADEIVANRFRIAGGSPGLKVSWQVTGIRHDPWAEAHRIPVETDKPDDERGTYLAPELYGQPEELGVHYELTHRFEPNDIR